MYTYKAVVNRIIDGNTLEVDLDLGFKTILKKEILRILGIDTPELRSGTDEEKQRGRDAKAFVETHFPPGTEITIKTQKDEKGKYGRYLAHVLHNESGADLTQLLLEYGFVKNKG